MTLQNGLVGYHLANAAILQLELTRAPDRVYWLLAPVRFPTLSCPHRMIAGHDDRRTAKTRSHASMTARYFDEFHLQVIEIEGLHHPLISLRPVVGLGLR